MIRNFKRFIFHSNDKIYELITGLSEKESEQIKINKIFTTRCLYLIKNVTDVDTAENVL